MGKRKGEKQHEARSKRVGLASPRETRKERLKREDMENVWIWKENEQGDLRCDLPLIWEEREQERLRLEEEGKLTEGMNWLQKMEKDDLMSEDDDEEFRIVPTSCGGLWKKADTCVHTYFTVSHRKNKEWSHVTKSEWWEMFSKPLKEHVEEKGIKFYWNNESEW
mmetsp:Transcript_206/g.314  ORF Transcript_206/g.314 Transcript_206/m.314 type:complete len:165 (-) Transcript_206:324-818(-)